MRRGSVAHNAGHRYLGLSSIVRLRVAQIASDLSQSEGAEQSFFLCCAACARVRRTAHPTGDATPTPPTHTPLCEV